MARAEAEFSLGQKETAHPARARKHFARSLECYQKLQKRGVHNPALYRNLGHSAFLAGQTGAAIFYFHLGLRLAVNDRELREQLENARDQAGVPAPLRPGASSWPFWLPRPSTNLILVLALVVYAWGCISFTRCFIGGRGKGWSLALFLVSVLLGMGWWLETRMECQEREPPLVVITAEEAPFFRGNGESYPHHNDWPVLPQGVEARKIGQRGDWLQIRLAGGQVGWIQKQNLMMADNDRRN